MIVGLVLRGYSPLLIAHAFGIGEGTFKWVKAHYKV